MDKIDIAEWLQGLQNDICSELETLDGSSFAEDLWEREEGGGGRTRVITGEHIEKGGVNFSAVYGPLNPQVKAALKVKDDEFFATGVSIVLHPRNPNVPIIHMNVRYFETGEKTWWFGGGIDLTPHYVVDEEARFFHSKLKEVCDRHDANYYKEYKEWADDYFFVRHRNETRGIGGIFYDQLKAPRVSRTSGFEFMKSVGSAFVPIYKQLFLDNYQKEYTPEQKDWQLIRRGRYVEFNLVWDRGTKFGLDTGGRTESILMSLPKDARWLYDHKPAEGSAEAETLTKLAKGIDWV